MDKRHYPKEKAMTKKILWTLIAILWLFHVVMYFTPFGTFVPHLLAVRVAHNELAE